MKLKIMYIISSLEKVGPTNQMYYLVKYLDKNIFEPIIITLFPSPPDSYHKAIKKLGISIQSLNLTLIKSLFCKNMLINDIINKNNPSIIQTHGFRSDRIKIKQMIPKIITLRTGSSKVVKPLKIKPKFMGRLLASLLYKYHLYYVKKCEFVVTCSKSLSLSLYNKLKVKLRYIQNGVDTTYFSPVSEKVKKGKRLKLNLPIDKKIYISIGSLNPKKNTLQIINLFKNSNYLNDSLLIVLGDGIEYNKYVKSVKKFDNIKLLGHSKDVRHFLQVSDYFISASKGEGLPNAVLEAMSSGIPCILSDIPSHREILKHKNLGVLFNLNNINELNKKIVEINNMDYNYLSTNCRNYIINNFSAQGMALNYQKLYHKVLNTQTL